MTEPAAGSGVGSVAAADDVATDEVEADELARDHEPSEIRMGNDIARALAYLGDEAPEQVATHIRKFWDPRMRSRLIDLARDGDPRISELLAAAVADYLAGEIDQAEVAKPSGG